MCPQKGGSQTSVREKLRSLAIAMDRKFRSALRPLMYDGRCRTNHMIHRGKHECATYIRGLHLWIASGGPSYADGGKAEHTPHDG